MNAWANITTARWRWNPSQLRPWNSSDPSCCLISWWNRSMDHRKCVHRTSSLSEDSSRSQQIHALRLSVESSSSSSVVFSISNQPVSSPTSRSALSVTTRTRVRQNSPLSVSFVPFAQSMCSHPRSVSLSSTL